MSNENTSSDGNIIFAFKEHLHEHIEWGQLSDDKFAMWLPSNEDPLFTTSPIREKWNIIYELIVSSWSYITADLLVTLGIIEDGKRLGLPEEFTPFAFLTPEGKQVVLSLSQEKGIRFHMAETTPLEYRIAFLDDFIAYCLSWNNMLNKYNGKHDEDIGFHNWWNLTVKVSITAEENEPLTGVGIITK